MADTPSNDDSVKEEVNEPVVTEESQDTDDIELEDIEVTEEELGLDDDDDETEETTEEETPASEESDEEESEADGEPEESSEEDDSQEESTDTSEEKSTEEDTSESSDDDTRKQKADEAYRERERKRQEAKAKREQEYLDEAEDEKDLALRQLQVDAYNNRIERNESKLEAGIAKAMSSIDIFKNGTPEEKSELVRRLDAFEAAYVQRDRNGDVINVTGDVFEFLNNEADSIRRLTGLGARQEKKAKSKTKARTLTTPSRKPVEPKIDKDIEDFDAAFED